MPGFSIAERLSVTSRPIPQTPIISPALFLIGTRTSWKASSSPFTGTVCSSSIVSPDRTRKSQARMPLPSLFTVDLFSRTTDDFGCRQSQSLLHGWIDF